MGEIALDILEASILDESARSRAPKYLCVVEAFKTCITSGRFKPGQRVPAETELSQRLPVSLGTVQKALTRLAERGFVVRHRKTGTFIADRSSQVAEVYVYRFRDSETGQLLMPFVKVLGVSQDDTNGPWKAALGVEKCIRIDRLVWVEQDPPVFSSLYLSHEHGSDLLDVPVEELHGSSCHRVLIERFNLPTLRMEHKVGCRTLSDRACEHLMIPKGTVGLVWDVRDFSFEDMPNLFQRFQMPPGHRPMELDETFNR